MALVASVGFAACRESSDLEMGELTEAEAQDLAGVVLLATFNSTGSVPQPAQVGSGLQAAPFELTAEFETSVECPLGGLVAVTADITVSGDTETEAAVIDYSMTQVHDACVAMSENQRQFTLWGAPSLGMDFFVESSGQGVVEWSGAIQGAVDWATDGREGTCNLAIEFSGLQQGDAAVSAELTGTVCGFTISQSVSIG